MGASLETLCRMNDHSANPPVDASVERVIEPEIKDLGGFNVRRVLPASARQMIGPFIFFDHFGPTEFAPGEGVQVRPHPHIGLSTVTYLFEGEIIHRDSLGYLQPIRAGEVNLMTAGRGIVHSERAGDDLNSLSRMHGIQSWMALPLEQEERDPDFVHYPAAELPGFEQDGASIRVIMGEAFGRESPVTQYAPTLYLECHLAAHAELTLPPRYDEMAAYVVSGQLRVGQQLIDAGRMVVAAAGQALRFSAASDSHVMIIGGAHLGKRHIWWNFVSSSRERIRQASEDWRDGRFDKVPGDDEFIPLPD
jgi:redox-sensitive bicupin YhaK (pirin superfamily)